MESKRITTEDLFEDDGFYVIANVADPIVKDSGVSKYIIYAVKGEDRDGVFEVFRRYSDFNCLRVVLQTRFPGVYVPAIPPKKATGNLDSEFIEERRKFLEYFMQELAKLKYLWYSDPVKIFLRSTNPDLEKTLNTIPKLSCDDIIYNYNQTFKIIAEYEINTNLESKITGFQMFLKKIKDQLEKYRSMIKNLISVRNQHNTEFKKFLTFLLPEYEKNCLREYTGDIGENKLIFVAENDPQLSEILNKIKAFMERNEFLALNELLKLETWEVDCFQEALQQLNQYEKSLQNTENSLKDAEKEQQKAQDGKTSSFKKLFSSKTNEDRVNQYQTKIDNFQTDIQNLKIIINMMKRIIGYYEIDQFKRDKVVKYYEVIKRVAQFEMEFAGIRAELWQHVIEKECIAEI